MDTVSFRRRAIRWPARIFLAGLLAAAGIARAADLRLPIDVDTYLDSAGPATNFGAATTVKVLIGSNGSAGRGLFRLPTEVGQYPTGKLAKVEVCFYVFSDQTAGRAIRLYPLTRPFAEGTGAIPADGATWNTSDGANAWTAAGGDFDVNFPVVGVAGDDGFFRWDVAALLAEPAARSNLLANGALLQIEESPLPPSGTPRAPFTSSEGTTASQRPYVHVAFAASLSFSIVDDAYLDSRAANVAKNYGAAITVKTLVNSSDASVCRGLFRLPPEIGLYDPADVVSAKAYFYVWQDNTADRNVTLYPLTRPFVEGSGNDTAPADGATWSTFDGTNAWTSPGGDFDTNFPVVGVKETILDEAQHDRFFSWDLAPLLANPAARSNLLAHGALLMIDETPVPATGMPRAPFTSSDDLSYAPAYRPRVDVKVAVRAPQVPQIAVADGNVTVRLADCTPLVACRIERTRDLMQTNGWTFVTNVVSTAAETNWMELLPPDWTNAFYRVTAVP